MHDAIDVLYHSIKENGRFCRGAMVALQMCTQKIQLGIHCHCQVKPLVMSNDILNMHLPFLFKILHLNELYMGQVMIGYRKNIQCLND